MAVAFDGLVVSNYIYLCSLFDSGSSGGHEMGPACWVRAMSGAVMVGDTPTLIGLGKAERQSGEAIRFVKRQSRQVRA